MDQVPSGQLPVPAGDAPSAGQEAAKARREVLSFVLGGELYAWDIVAVQEIIGPSPLSRLPRSPAWVLGVMNLRGRVIPVYDLRLRLDLDPEAGQEPVYMVLRAGGKTVAFVVDGVRDVLLVDPELVQPTPEFSGRFSGQGLVGLLRQDSEMIRLLDPELLLQAM